MCLDHRGTRTTVTQENNRISIETAKKWSADVETLIASWLHGQIDDEVAKSTLEELQNNPVRVALIENQREDHTTIDPNVELAHHEMNEAWARLGVLSELLWKRAIGESLEVGCDDDLISRQSHFTHLLDGTSEDHRGGRRPPSLIAILVPEP